MSFNNMTIVGRMTRDGEQRTTQTGKSVVSFSVAVNRMGKDSETDFFDCQAWEKTGNFVTQYLGKGRLVLVSGRMESRKHEDKTYWTLTANEVKGLDRPKDDAPKSSEEYDWTKDA